MKDQQKLIQVGISSCLLGQMVRFDGNHKHQKFITDELGKLFEYVAVCPEMAIGMGVPRKPIRLVNDMGTLRAQGVRNASFDVTDQLVEFGKEKAANIQNLSGYIFKKRSPSCGMHNVRVYHGKDLISTKGVGLFAKEIMSTNPLLPVEDEGRLTDRGIRENFIQRVVIYHRWKTLQATNLSVNKIIDFHTRHKFILLAHHEQTYRNLGRLVAQAGLLDPETLGQEYIARLMYGLKMSSTRARHTNVLQHIMGFLKRHITSSDKQELSTIIDEYRKGELPLDAPIILLRHHVKKLQSNYMQQQYYLFNARL